MTRFSPLLVAGLLLTASAAGAQTKRGTAIGQFLTIQPSARSVAMGGAGVGALAESALDAYLNPAVLGRLTRADVGLSYSPWLVEVRHQYASVAVPAGRFGTVGLNLTMLSSGEMDVRSVEQPLGTGERFTADDFSLGLAYGRKLTDRFSLGGQVTYVHERIWHSAFSTVGFTIGTLYQLGENGLQIGAGLANLGPESQFSGRDLRIDYDQNPDQAGDNGQLPAEIQTEQYGLPLLFRFGLGLPVRINSDNELRLAIDALHPSDNTESVRLGGEWTTLKRLSLRAGYDGLFQAERETGFTAGAGVVIPFTGANGLRADYAWAEHGRLGNVQRFTVGFGF